MALKQYAPLWQPGLWGADSLGIESDLDQHTSPRYSSPMQLPTPPVVIWFTGLSGAGKTTLASRLVEDLAKQNRPLEFLDGDKVRDQLGQAGFQRADRMIHLQAMAFAAGRLEAHGVTVVGAFITPYEAAREILRRNCRNYLEVWVDTPLAECEKRDVKGLYARARRGELKNFTGIDDPFETPTTASIRLTTQGQSVEDTYQGLKVKLRALGVVV